MGTSDLIPYVKTFIVKLNTYISLSQYKLELEHTLFYHDHINVPIMVRTILQ